MNKQKVTQQMMQEHREANTYIGTHIIADFWHCKYRDEAFWLRNILINAAHLSHATVLDSSYHQFEPEGSTAILLLGESHISIHTWPEYNYIAIDIFTCGHHMSPDAAIEYLQSVLKPKRTKVKSVRRGYKGAPRK